MGMDGSDFIGNPNQMEYTDDELDMDDILQIRNDEFDEEYVGGEDVYDYDDDAADADADAATDAAAYAYVDAEEEEEDEEDFVSSSSLSCQTSPDASDFMDDFLTDDDEDSEAEKLVGYMLNGVFVQTGMLDIITRSRTGGADAPQAVAERAPQTAEEAKNGNEDVAAAAQDVATRADGETS